MRGWLSLCVTAGLCVATSWAGHHLGVQSAVSEESTASAAKEMDRKPVSKGGPDDSAVSDLHRVAARCDTAALWAYLDQSENYGTGSSEIYDELLDRLGTKAVDSAFDLTDKKARVKAVTELLERLAKKDRSAALNSFLAHRAEIPPGETLLLEYRFIDGAYAQSAEVMIATCDLLKSRTDMLWAPFDPHFTPDFDSQKALDYVAGDKAVSELAPDLLRNWAKTQPVEAARWLLAHPDLSRVKGGGPMIAAGSNVVAAVAAIASSPAEGRSEAFATLMKLPEEIRQSTWESFTGSQSRPEMLEAATAMGVREKYLQEAFLTTRADNVNPAFWTQVSADEREALLSAEQQRWSAGESHTPVLETIHSAWLERVKREWAAAAPH